MPDWLIVVILGIVEGITEFLPISSTGHLLLTRQWVRATQPDLFYIVIQSGAVLAVVLIFKERLRQLLFRWRDAETRDYLFKLTGAFAITGAGGLAMKAADFELPETALPVILALLIGGVLFLVIERWLKGRKLSDRITWTVAIVIGVAQLVAAAFPGTSRSGATILFALMLGLDRRKAVEFTFLLGVPTLLAAGGLELVSHFRDPEAAPVDWTMLGLGTVVSAATAFIAVKWLLRYVQTHTFEIFGWYRIALGLLMLVLLKA